MFSAVDAYDRFVGRYSPGLARQLIALSGVAAGMRALDVGCGTGLLTMELVRILGPAKVAGIDPSEAFVTAVRERLPGVDIRVGPAEEVPFEDGSFDATFAQLVVNFLDDADAGVAQMRRVTRSGGVVVAAVWDYAGGMTLLRTFWDAARSVSTGGEARDERHMRYRTPEELRALWESAGLTKVETSAADVTADYAGFEDLWAPFEKGIGPAGAYLLSLPEDERPLVKAEMKQRLGVGDEPFKLTARAWAVVGRVP